ncbi:hypothetical protein BKA93DRAFT_760516, partial [Sparassis latifolia]
TPLFCGRPDPTLDVRGAHVYLPLGDRPVLWLPVYKSAQFRIQVRLRNSLIWWFALRVRLGDVLLHTDCTGIKCIYNGISPLYRRSVLHISPLTTFCASSLVARPSAQTVVH